MKKRATQLEHGWEACRKVLDHCHEYFLDGGIGDVIGSNGFCWMCLKGRLSLCQSVKIPAINLDPVLFGAV